MTLAMGLIAVVLVSVALAAGQLMAYFIGRDIKRMSEDNER